jgi:hypothetical protein
MDRIRDSVLELILDSSGTKEEHIAFDELSSIIQSFSTTINGVRSLIVNLRP